MRPLELEARIGPLYVSFGGYYRRVGRWYVPDGLSAWWCDRGVHSSSGTTKEER